MTLNEMADLTGLATKEDCIGFLMVAFEVIRTAIGERCTSGLEWRRRYGQPGEQSVRKWLTDAHALSTLDIPDKFVEETKRVQNVVRRSALLSVTGFYR